MRECIQCVNTALFDGPLCRACEDKGERSERIVGLVEAVENFAKAIVTYERRLTTDPEWANATDVNETREALVLKLDEVMP
jgi:hypothetical protein